MGQTHKRNMKWIILILGIGILRGVIFPDYRFGPNIFIIPFGMPLLVVGIVAYLVAKKNLKWFALSVSGLVSVYLSTGVGILVYGASVGWQYVTNDVESQIVFMTTISFQTITYLIGLGLSSFIVKRYNSSLKQGREK